jgi:CubicO group peptidase (beta-lactamase class C family)
MRFLLFALLLAGLSAHADLAVLQTLFKKAAVLGFEGQVTVSRGEKTLWQGNVGFAERAEKRPIDERTLFDIGSVTKQFTATAILKLQQQGKLNIDEPLAKYLELPSYVQDVTIRQALQHRSGLGYPPDEAPIDWESKDAKKVYEQIFRYAEYDPARPFNYNNLMYSALSEVVHIVSGRPFEEFLKEELYVPAGLAHTGFNTPGSVDLTHSARGYNASEAGFLAGELPSGNGYDGATGVITDAFDLRRWLLKVHRGEILGPLTNELFVTPADGEAYGLGWEIDASSHSHTGSTIGFFSLALFYPADETSLLILSNDWSGGWVLALARKVWEGKIAEKDLDEEIRKVRESFKPASVFRPFRRPEIKY